MLLRRAGRIDEARPPSDPNATSDLMPRLLSISASARSCVAHMQAPKHIKSAERASKRSSLDAGMCWLGVRRGGCAVGAGQQQQACADGAPMIVCRIVGLHFCKGLHSRFTADPQVNSKLLL